MFFFLEFLIFRLFYLLKIISQMHSLFLICGSRIRIRRALTRIRNPDMDKGSVAKRPGVRECQQVPACSYKYATSLQYFLKSKNIRCRVIPNFLRC